MAKGSVRKKGKKWYYRFYVEDASGNLVQKEYPMNLIGGCFTDFKRIK